MHSASVVGQDVAGKFNQDQNGKGLSSTLEFLLTGGSIEALWQHEEFEARAICHQPIAMEMGSSSSSRMEC